MKAIFVLVLAGLLTACGSSAPITPDQTGDEITSGRAASLTSVEKLALLGITAWDLPEDRQEDLKAECLAEKVESLYHYSITVCESQCEDLNRRLSYNRNCPGICEGNYERDVAELEEKYNAHYVQESPMLGSCLNDIFESDDRTLYSGLVEICFDEFETQIKDTVDAYLYNL